MGVLPADGPHTPGGLSRVWVVVDSPEHGWGTRDVGSRPYIPRPVDPLQTPHAALADYHPLTTLTRVGR